MGKYYLRPKWGKGPRPPENRFSNNRFSDSLCLPNQSKCLLSGGNTVRLPLAAAGKTMHQFSSAQPAARRGCGRCAGCAARWRCWLCRFWPPWRRLSHIPGRFLPRRRSKSHPKHLGGLATAVAFDGRFLRPEQLCAKWIGAVAESGLAGFEFGGDGQRARLGVAVAIMRCHVPDALVVGFLPALAGGGNIGAGVIGALVQAQPVVNGAQRAPFFGAVGFGLQFSRRSNRRRGYLLLRRVGAWASWCR